MLLVTNPDDADVSIKRFAVETDVVKYCNASDSEIALSQRHLLKCKAAVGRPAWKS